MIERLLEMVISGFILSSLLVVLGPILSYLSNRPQRSDGGFFEMVVVMPFGAFIFYFISLYGISCILFGLIFRSPIPRRHAKIMTAAFSVHVIGFFITSFVYNVFVDGQSVESYKHLLLELLSFSLVAAVPGIPAVWIANYAGGVFYRWAIARSGKTTLTS